MEIQLILWNSEIRKLGDGVYYLKSVTPFKMAMFKQFYYIIFNQNQVFANRKDLIFCNIILDML